MKIKTSYHSERLRLWVILNRVLHVIARESEADLRAHDLTAREFSVLELLLTRGPLRTGEVSASVLLQSGSTTYVIDKLIERGLIARIQSPADARCFYVELTKKGRKLTEKTMETHVDYMDSLMSSLSAEEAKSVADSLKKLGNSIKKRNSENIS